MDRIDALENEIESLKKRNRKVEADKAWETSMTRKAGIAFLTYLVILSFFLIIDVADPFVAAIVPTLGFLLSTSGLDFIKKIWIVKVYDRK